MKEFEKLKEESVTIRLSRDLKNKLQQMADDDLRKLTAFLRLKLEALAEANDDNSFEEKQKRIKAKAAKINQQL